ncbi:MAG: hypothetical protein IPG63_00635 [Xanthomonadales bacterium]|jgi:hypothetical protein|nr:hypothetical protein [Xanthomonadales bacterium]MBK7145415.1 hypothetical protein [Xanthomonadales bacterium]
MNRLGFALAPALLLLNLAGSALASERDAAPAMQSITLAQTAAPARPASTTVPVKRLSLAAAAVDDGTDSGGICAVECKTGVQTILGRRRAQAMPARLPRALLPLRL